MTFDWDVIKPICYDLYVRQKLYLNDVARIINTKQNSHIHHRTFRDKFRKWGYRRSDHKEKNPRKSKGTKGRGSNRAVGARNSPRRDSTRRMSSRRNSPRITSPRRSSRRRSPEKSGPGTPVLRASGPPRPTGSNIVSPYLPSNALWEIYDDIESAHQSSEQNPRTSMGGITFNAGFLDGAESIERNLGATPASLPLIHRSLRELSSTQRNTRDSPARPQLYQSVNAKCAVFGQDGIDSMMQSRPNLEALQVPQSEMYATCQDRIGTPWKAGEFVPSYEPGCLYTGMPDMRAPSTPPDWTQNSTTPELYRGGVLGSNLGEEYQRNPQAMTAQSWTSSHYPSCPSLTQNSSLESVTERNIFHLPPRGRQLHDADTSNMDCNKRTHNVGSLPRRLQHENASPSLQRHQRHYIDASSLGHIGSQMDDSPYAMENHDLPWHSMQSENADTYRPQQHEAHLLQGWYPDMAQAVNATAPPVVSYESLLHENSANAMTTSMPQVGSYALPSQSYLDWQDTSMAAPGECLGMPPYSLHPFQNVESSFNPFDNDKAYTSAQEYPSL